MIDNLLLIDTDVLIDFGRGVGKAREQLNDQESVNILTISVVTQLELMVGCENKADFKSLQSFLKNFEIIQLDNTISEKAVHLFEKYRLSHGVMIPDMLIASTAITFEIPLMSKNQKDYRFIKGLKLIEYKGV
ncbi:MAG: type II toxin-antitoxin system VapC family toxin [Balneolales bacterium]